MSGSREERLVGSKTDHRPLRVLVVDDHLETAEALSMLLRSIGNVVAKAGDGLGALALSEVFLPHVVFLDIDLPDISGYEVASRLRERFGFDKLLLIAATGRGTAEDRAHSRAAGFDFHIQKPYGMEQVAYAVGLRQRK